MIKTGAGVEASAVGVLGPLLTVSEVLLWDDLRSRIRDASVLNDSDFEPANSCSTVADNSSTCSASNENISMVELELAQQMNALDLPLSFGSSKAMHNVTSKPKRKGKQLKSVDIQKAAIKQICQVIRLGQMDDTASSTILYDSTNVYNSTDASSYIYNMEGRFDAVNHDAKADSICEVDFHNASKNDANKKPLGDDTCNENIDNHVNEECTHDTVSLHWNNEVLGSSNLECGNCLGCNLEDTTYRHGVHLEGGLSNEPLLKKSLDDSSPLCHDMHPNNDNANTATLQCLTPPDSTMSCEPGLCHANFIPCESREWRVVWDPFYERNYFLNVLSKESTWHPPPGLEKYAFPCNTTSNKCSLKAASEQIVVSDYDVSSSVLECGSDFHPQHEQHGSSSMIDMGINLGSHISIGQVESSHMQLSLHSSDVRDGISAEIHDCGNMDKQEGKQEQCMSAAYSGHHDVLLTAVCNDENACCSLLTYTGSPVDDPDGHENAAVSKKMRIRRPQLQFKVQGPARCLSNSVMKYWCQRYSLFSRFDDGIKMDEEGWFSVTPEKIAKHHALRCGGGIIIDCFAGVGGNSIQFAMRSNHVIAIDVDPQKIDYAQHNAVIYGVTERIDFINADFFQITSSLKGDVVFLSPPWGGPDYAKMHTYDIRSLKPHDGYFLFKKARAIAPKVVMFLPRNVNVDQLVELSLSVHPAWSLEVEKNYLNGKLKSITAYLENTTAK
ncbi:trimethylguanosine synthase [Apostasia shenzhenica]|uniref:Trimethylguanosine synthase n=1 Tax=Apostasia shenzhenica TaxID=1088818 RepID=A0A2I0B7K5_9ASPA|nr:trimethylguanosine synthase [Apostasia shenzhenica]